MSEIQKALDCVGLLNDAYRAANEFIDSHVADPDITSEMVEKYQAYNEAKDKFENFIKTAPKQAAEEKR